FDTDQKWSPVVQLTESSDSLAAGVLLYKWRDTVIGWQPIGGGRCFFINRENNSWRQTQLNGLPKDYLQVEPAMDPNSGRALFSQAFTESDKLVMKSLLIDLGGIPSVRDAEES